jgi:hypothetical protein
LEWLQTRTFLAADIFKAGVLFAALSAAKDWETMVQISEVKGNNKTVVHIFWLQAQLERIELQRIHTSGALVCVKMALQTRAPQASLANNKQEKYLQRWLVF